MGNCKKCGAEVSNNAMFCKKCGAPIEKDVSTINSEKEVKEFEFLSLEMRTLFDKMLASYVSGMQAVEVEKSKTAENFKKEILEIQELLDSRNEELKVLKDKLDVREREITLLKEKIMELESNKKVDVVNNEENNICEENPQFCYGCGEPITEDMLFCGTCGMKLK